MWLFGFSVSFHIFNSIYIDILCVWFWFWCCDFLVNLFITFQMVMLRQKRTFFGESPTTKIKKFLNILSFHRVDLSFIYCCLFSCFSFARRTFCACVDIFWHCTRLFSNKLSKNEDNSVRSQFKFKNIFHFLFGAFVLR